MLAGFHFKSLNDDFFFFSNFVRQNGQFHFSGENHERRRAGRRRRFQLRDDARGNEDPLPDGTGVTAGHDPAPVPARPHSFGQRRRCRTHPRTPVEHSLSMYDSILNFMIQPERN